MTEPTWTILTVCTMNICRSPALAAALAQRVSADTHIGVQSAGTQAVVGAPACPVIGQELGSQVPDHRSQLLSDSLVRQAGLILTAHTDHARVVAQRFPYSYNRILPVTTAATAAMWLDESRAWEIARAKAAGEAVEVDRQQPGTLVAPLPATRVERLDWLVSELNEARGMLPTAERSWSQWDSTGLPDPHVEGWQLHRGVAQVVPDLIETIATAVMRAAGGLDEAE